MSIKRLLCLVSAWVVTMLLFSGASASVEDTLVVSAPLRRAAEVQDGMVRVWLESIGDVSRLDVTVKGRYSVNGNSALSLYDGQTVNIGFSKVTGEITLTMNGVTYAVGSEMRLRRHQANGESALSIAQASRPSNLYPGDLRLLAVKKSDGSYRLYPIMHVYLEYYLQGVVPYEMSSANPIEALKAQAVAARTYTMRAMNARSSYSYDVRDTAADQVYKGYTGSVSNATKAVDETKGIVAMNGGTLTGTYYTASNGGQTESVKNAWGSSSYAYLKVKDDPFDALNSASTRRKMLVYRDFDHPSQNATLSSILTEKARSQLGQDAVIQTIHAITPHTPKYPAPSRLYTKLDFEVTALSGGSQKRAVLSFDIFSSLESQLSMSINGGQNELWSVETKDEGFQIVAARWGHGIGLSQRGAQQMAKMGYTYDQILGFYYEGCERVQYTFTHTILPVGGSEPIISTEPPADITPAEKDRATVSLPGAKDTIALRYTASENGKVLTGVPNGSAVTMLHGGADWCLVRYGEINGYLPASALVFSGEASGSSADTATQITIWGVVSGTDSLNFRSGPGYTYDILTELPSGTVLCILNTVSQWVKVQYGSRVGYVSPDYLTVYSEYPAQTNANTSAMVSLANTGDTAALLMSPSMSATVLMQLHHGDQVTVLSNDGSWCRVKVAGMEGYLLASQLDFDAKGTAPTPPPGSQGISAIVNSDASTLNLREGPSTEDKVLVQIPKGTTITVTAYGETWCAVRWGDYSGYVMTKYLRFDQETPSPSPSGSPSTSPSPSTAPTELTAWVMRTVNYVNLRETASTEAKIITQIPAGDEVTVLEKGGTFTRVRHGVGTGYVLSKHLTYTEPLDSIGIMYIDTISDPLAMRDQPSTSGSKVLTYIPRGEKVLLIKELDGWCQVQYGDYVGYCASVYLSRKRPNEYEADDTPIYDPSLAGAEGWSAVVHTGGLTLPLRKWCASDAPVLVTIPDGKTVKLLARGEIWCKITFEGKDGYCLTEKLILQAPTGE